MRHVLARKLLAVLLAFGAFYCMLAMATQAMLGGVTPEEVSRDRLYAWSYFLAAGWLAIATFHLWRSTANPHRQAARRLAMLALAHLLLTSGLYVLDLVLATPG